jgi:catechol 2,3-dioxygenase
MLKGNTETDMEGDQGMQSSMTPANPASARIHPATDVGLVALTVSDLERSLAFYTDVMGFALLRKDAGEAVLGAGDVPLLALRELPGAPHAPQSATGLYHFAILVPSRADLGRWLRHWLVLGLPLPGQGDHLVSEALYFSDPEGNGIEVYRDRPRAEWRWANGQVQMATDPVDIRGLLAEAEAEGKPWEGMPSGTKIGHMHLQIGDVERARAFYADLLGFDVVAQMPSALFVSAGGYHHHIGMNTWHSRGRGPAPEGSAGLRYFTLRLPDVDAVAAVVARLDAAGIPHHEESGGAAFDDPWRNRIVFTVGTMLPDKAR